MQYFLLDLPACNRNYLIRDIIKQPKRLLNPKANPKESRAGYYLTSITEHNILQQNNLELFKKVLVIGTPFINRDNEVCLNVSFAKCDDNLEKTYKNTLIDFYTNL